MLASMKTPISLRLDVTLHEQIIKQAARERRTITSMIEFALSEYVHRANKSVRKAQRNQEVSETEQNI